MQFSHRDNAARTATLEQISDAPPTWVVRYEDATGRGRKKTFKNNHDAALRFLLNKEGFVLRGPQPGPVKWMTRLMQPYYGEVGHAVDGETGSVWVVDAEDRINRVTPGSCEIVSAALGTGTQSPGWKVVAGAGGSAWVLATSWRKDDGLLVRRGWLFRVAAEGDGLSVSEVDRFEGATTVMALSAAVDGRVLAPDASGLALYGADGKVLERWAVPAQDPVPDPTRRVQLASAAMSSNGEWLAVGAPPAVRIIRISDGTERTVPAEMKVLGELQVSDDGVAFASGFAYPHHALFRLDAAALTRLSPDTRATVSSDGAQLAEVAVFGVALRDLAKPAGADSLDPYEAIAKQHLPVLGIAKYGKARFGRNGELVVLTDAYTVSAVTLG